MQLSAVDLSRKASQFATHMYLESGQRRDMPQQRYRVIEQNMGFMHGVDTTRRNFGSLYIISEFSGIPVVEVSNTGRAFFVKDNFVRESVIENELFAKVVPKE